MSTVESWSSYCCSWFYNKIFNFPFKEFTFFPCISYPVDGRKLDLRVMTQFFLRYEKIECFIHVCGLKSTHLIFASPVCAHDMQFDLWIIPHIWAALDANSQQVWAERERYFISLYLSFQLHFIYVQFYTNERKFQLLTLLVFFLFFCSCKTILDPNSHIFSIAVYSARLTNTSSVLCSFSWLSSGKANSH